MAAATENGVGRTECVEGNHAVIYCNITWSASNTFDTGFDSILMSTFMPTTSVAGQIGLSKSGGTLTRSADALGALTGDLKVVGTGGQ